MSTKIRPLHDRIIVRRVDADEKTSGGLYIPDSAKDKPQHGIVVAVGKGKVKEDGTIVPIELKEKDKILFGKYAGTEVKVGEEELLIMREDDVLGVVEA
ncbi:MAG: co-chaperone GroES [Deltaproteobacteria bacterium]|nr:co-chaperone GroES [Deltaproteobacteria bacterium]